MTPRKHEVTMGTSRINIKIIILLSKLTKLRNLPFSLYILLYFLKIIFHNFFDKTGQTLLLIFKLSLGQESLSV